MDVQPSSPFPETKLTTLPSLLLDGATGTNLYLSGMPQGVCIEEYLISNPDIIAKLQADFVNAGSDIIIAPTFSANKQKLTMFGLQDKVYDMNLNLVSITKSVAKGRLVAGNMSPTGLFIEPYGDATFDNLLEIYSEQAHALNDAGVDLFIIETMLSISEARAAILSCIKYNKPVYVTFTINERGRTLSGATPLGCLIALQDLGIHAFGLNCSFGPSSLAPYIKELVSFSKIPIIAKPNAGMPNPLLPNVYDLSPTIMAEEMVQLLDNGATIIGGCCGTTPQHIECMRNMLDSYVKVEHIGKELQSNDIILANETQTFSLDNDRIDFTHHIKCEHDMADSFMDIEDDSLDVMVIQIDTIDDSIMFGLNAHLTRLPICFFATDESALNMALKLYHGKAMIDSKSPIDETNLQFLAKKYGAVVY